VKPIFTVHAGEYLTAEHIEREFPYLRAWVPTRDSGIDLLVSHPKTRRFASLQVKYSKDFKVTHLGPSLQPRLRACGWWTLSRSKIETSPADHWVFILYGFARASIDQIVIRPGELLQRLRHLHGEGPRYQVYLWTTSSERCWETRGLKSSDHAAIAEGSFRNADRDFSAFLGKWSCLERLGPPE
jgi:hypothetical protein